MQKLTKTMRDLSKTLFQNGVQFAKSYKYKSKF